ncbi:MAG: RNA 2',3'-cyclic phosphodiesterase [Methylococcus sp.]|nr:MAG: RNA 2',3'-cyclic phosphodiesterase [Methylococcus sp.]
MPPNPKAKRLFLALWPGFGVRDGLRERRETLCPRSGRWVPVDNFHVTLAFLGNVTLENIALLEKSVSGIRCEGFSIQLDWICQAPSQGMIWAVPGTVPLELPELVRKLRGAIAEPGLRVDARPYRPHVTLVKKFRGSLQPFRVHPLGWQVRGFALVESMLCTEGTIYTVRRTWAAGRFDGLPRSDRLQASAGVVWPVCRATSAAPVMKKWTRSYR